MFIANFQVCIYLKFQCTCHRFPHR